MIDNFVFRKEWHDVLKGCSPEVRQEVYEAIMTYAFEDRIVEMSDMSRMAFAFIRPQIDAMRDKYRARCEQNRANASGRKQTQPNASDGSDSKPYNNNNNNNDNDSLSFEEREKIFEIFYFERNLITAKEECEKFINHYEANGWCRGNSDKPVKSKVALAKSWKVEREEKRLPDNINRWLHGVYNKLKDEGKDAWRIFTIEGVVIEQGVVVIKCNRQIAELIESVAVSIPRDFDKLSYRVRKEA